VGVRSRRPLRRRAVRSQDPPAGEAGSRAAFDPATHVSTSVHQTYGPCHVEAKDITGHTRFESLCAQDFDEDFTFDCGGELPLDGDQWYTVCGRPHDRVALRLLAIAGFAALGIAAFLCLLVAPRTRSRK
jgi:hypothetical protein